jgi:hypothetical protein
MIRYALICEYQHEFEGWFATSSDFDDQETRRLIACPNCGSVHVRKAIMAPAVVGVRDSASAARDEQAEVRQTLEAVREHVETNFDDVGDAFASEARAIHEGRSEERGIFGQASPQDVRDLIADGVSVLPMPPKPIDKEKLN